MNTRLLKLASSVASFAIPLALLTGCPPPDFEWHAEADVRPMTQATLVTVESTRRPEVEGLSRAISTYELSPEAGAKWPGTGVYFLPPGMRTTFEISGECPGNQDECNPPKDQGIKIVDTQVVDTFALRASAPSVDLNNGRSIKSKHLDIVVSTNLIPMMECSSGGKCISDFDIGALDNGDGTWDLMVYWAGETRAPLFTPHIVAYGRCEGDEACTPGADDHLTIVSAKMTEY